jgi:hypothetical protein
MKMIERLKRCIVVWDLPIKFKATTTKEAKEITSQIYRLHGFVSNLCEICYIS